MRAVFLTARQIAAGEKLGIFSGDISGDIGRDQKSVSLIDVARRVIGENIKLINSMSNKWEIAKLFGGSFLTEIVFFLFCGESYLQFRMKNLIGMLSGLKLAQPIFDDFQFWLRGKTTKEEISSLLKSQLLDHGLDPADLSDEAKKELRTHMGNALVEHFIKMCRSYEEIEGKATKQNANHQNPIKLTEKERHSFKELTEMKDWIENRFPEEFASHVYGRGACFCIDRTPNHPSMEAEFSSMLLKFVQPKFAEIRKVHEEKLEECKSENHAANSAKANLENLKNQFQEFIEQYPPGKCYTDEFKVMVGKYENIIAANFLKNVPSKCGKLDFSTSEFDTSIGKLSKLSDDLCEFNARRNDLLKPNDLSRLFRKAKDAVSEKFKRSTDACLGILKGKIQAARQEILPRFRKVVEVNFGKDSMMRGIAEDCGASDDLRNLISSLEGAIKDREKEFGESNS
ncbi:MAG: hypothetical protein LBS68_03090 [Puniceicoccales bacterium]|nr:hypothetical protein [Puniceicoccales bacterium]